MSSVSKRTSQGRGLKGYEQRSLKAKEEDKAAANLKQAGEQMRGAVRE
jgi:hypothetical protein